MLKKILIVIIKPKLGWQYIDDSGNSTQRVLSGVFFPLLAILAISSHVVVVTDGCNCVFLKLYAHIFLVQLSSFGFLSRVLKKPYCISKAK